MDPNNFIKKPPLSIDFLSLAAWIPSIMAGTAKGCTMGSGMAGILMLAFGLPALASPLGMAIGGISLFCGFTVALVSIFKEGSVLQRRLSKLLLKHVKGNSQPTYGTQYEKEFTHEYTDLLNHPEEKTLGSVDVSDFSKQYVEHRHSEVSKATKFTYRPEKRNTMFWDNDRDSFLGVPSTMNYVHRNSR